ncbi:MAG: hypothetical protein ACKO96_07410, partial [Flammeovirgaceae bacterium]
MGNGGGGYFEEGGSYYEPRYVTTNSFTGFMGIRYNSVWQLSEMLSPSGASIFFEYVSFGPTSYEFNQSVSTDLPNKVDTTFSFQKSGAESVAIKSINLNSTYSLFNLEVFYTKELVSSVKLKETVNNSFKEFKFLYQPVSNPSEGTATRPAISKIFLKELREETNCGAYPSYQFSYYNVTFSTSSTDPVGTTDIPFTKRQPADLWGYFTNRTGTSLVPNIYKNAGITNNGAERYRFDIRQGNGTDLPGYTLLPGGSDRSVAPAFAHYGSLQRITKPTGGYTEIQYEPNTWYDATLQKDVMSAGVRVKSLRVSDGDADASNDIVTNFDYSWNGFSSGKLTHPFVFTFESSINSVDMQGAENFYKDTELFYQRVTESAPGQGRTVYDFLLPAMYPATSSNDWQISPATYGSVTNRYFTYPFGPSTNYDFERGLPERVTTYREGRTIPLTEKIFTYQRLNGPGGASTITSSRYGLQPYNWLVNTYKTIQSETTRLYDPNSSTARYTESITSYVYSDTLALPRVVTTTNSDGAVSQSIFKYAKDYNATGAADTQSGMIAQLQSTNRHASLIESYNKVNGAVVSANLTLFSIGGGGGIPMPKQQLKLASPTGYTVSKVQGGIFSYAKNNYYTTQTVEKYDFFNNVLSSTDVQRNRQSVHYGYRNSLPVVSISQARPEEVVYTDFESSTGYEMTYPAGDVISSDKWSGKKCLTFKPGVALEKTNVGKANRYYIFSCRVKATTTSNINLSVQVFNGATRNGSATLTYPASASGQWRYLETSIDLNAASTNFTLRTTTSAQ